MLKVFNNTIEARRYQAETTEETARLIDSICSPIERAQEFVGVNDVIYSLAIAYRAGTAEDSAEFTRICDDHGLCESTVRGYFDDALASSDDTDREDADAWAYYCMGDCAIRDYIYSCFFDALGVRVYWDSEARADSGICDAYVEVLLCCGGPDVRAIKRPHCHFEVIGSWWSEPIVVIDDQDSLLDRWRDTLLACY